LSTHLVILRADIQVAGMMLQVGTESSWGVDTHVVLTVDDLAI